MRVDCALLCDAASVREGLLNILGGGITRVTYRPRTRAKTAARGYTARHNATSKTLRAQAVGTPCCLCGEVMLPGQPLALDHTPDRTGYRGVAHATCNARDGAIRGNKMRARRRVLRVW